MRLREDSFFAKLVLNSYASYELPKSLCPFFWKLVIALVSLPLTWPILVIDWVGGRPEKSWILSKIILGILTQLVVLAIIGVAYVKPIETLKVLGFMVVVLVVILGGVALYTVIKEKIEDWYWNYKYGEYGEKLADKKTDNVLVSFIKAKKEKVCPRIDWIKKNK